MESLKLPPELSFAGSCLVGGIASEIGGGEFWQGAASAAIGNLANHWGHNKYGKPTFSRDSENGVRAFGLQLETPDGKLGDGNYVGADPCNQGTTDWNWNSRDMKAATNTISLIFGGGETIMARGLINVSSM